jgi:hypothetical protein
VCLIFIRTDGGAGARGGSDSMAKSYLEKFSWDLMRAVDEFYASGGESLTPV